VAVLAVGSGILIATRSNSAAQNPTTVPVTTPVSITPKSLPATSSRPVAPPLTTTPDPGRSSKSLSTSKATTSLSTSLRTTPKPTVDPATCSSKPDAKGVTGCMDAVIGSLADLNCSQNPDVLDLDATTVAEIQTLTTSWTACIDDDKNYAAVIFQTTGGPGRETMWPFVEQQFTATRHGSWKAGANSGIYSAGKSSSGTPLVGWKDSQAPVLAFIGSSNGSSVDSVIAYWKAALGATITG
jgi:hypothetical protein